MSYRMNKTQRWVPHAFLISALSLILCGKQVLGKEAKVFFNHDLGPSSISTVTIFNPILLSPKLYQQTTIWSFHQSSSIHSPNAPISLLKVLSFLFKQLSLLYLKDKVQTSYLTSTALHAQIQFTSLTIFHHTLPCILICFQNVSNHSLVHFA